ncbi:MAG: phenylalanine--tRNA ligase subunit beta, partial [Verrucomicrobiales bacterium]|nr:phenylalanine--tRNA ligase subunit beta [Verrucomicrobiales bacterium]
RNLKLALAARGFYEAQTIKLIADAQVADALLLDPATTPIRVSLPLSDDHTTLRPSLLPGLLTVAARNVRQGASTIRFIEAGTVFSGGTGTEESQHLALLVSGDAIPTSWAEKSDRSLDVFDLTGVLSSVAPLELKPTEDPAFLLSADLTIAGKKIGRLVQLHPARARELDLDSAVVAAELDLDKLRNASSQQPRFQELPKFPAITRDVAMELPLDLPNADLAAFFTDARQAEPLLQSASPFDLFVDSSGEKISPDRKSLAYNLVYRDPTRTLKTEEVDAAHERILGSLTSLFPAQIR